MKWDQVGQVGHGISTALFNKLYAKPLLLLKRTLKFIVLVIDKSFAEQSLIRLPMLFMSV